MNLLSQTFTFAVGRVLTLLALVTLSCSFAMAQADASSRSPRPSLPSPDSNGRMLADAEVEMRVKRDIEFADKAHRDNVGRARDLATITASLVETFTKTQALADAEIKKLEKAEKLAKRIREAAGGEEAEAEILKPPADLEATMNRLSELSASLRDKVEKTPKHVVSAAIIDESNTILKLIRSIRLQRKS